MNATEHFDRIDKYVRRDGITEAMESITALRATLAEMERQQQGSPARPTSSVEVPANRESASERISVLENALLHYAERTNWKCRRCGGSDDLNCAMLFWKGPIGMDGDPAYGHGWSIARAALSSTTQSEPAATHVKVTTNPSDPFATRDLETGGYYKWVEPEQKPGSPLHPQNSVESERES